MQKIICLAILSLLAQYCTAQNKLPYGAKQNEALTIYVHPGTELMTIVQILAGKYSDQTASSYNEEMKAWFYPFREHPAVKYLAALDKQIYPDLIELGWCFDDFPNISLFVPENTSWYKNYGKDSVAQYLNLVKQFYTDSKFWEFYKSHESLYSKWGEAMKSKILSTGALEKLYSFYNTAKEGKWYIEIEPLNGWGAHAVTHINDINPLYKDYVIYETGYFNDNATQKSEPSFSLNEKAIQELLWHEGSHHMLKAVLSKYKNEISELSYLFNKDDEGMRRNNISNWTYCLEENVVRSVVACLIRKSSGERKYEKEVDIQDYMDFIYVKTLSPFIYTRYIQSEYKSFDHFFPELLKLLKEKFKTVSHP